MSSAPSGPHPEIPEHRDHSLLITEAQQEEMIADLARLEHELDRVHRETEARTRRPAPCSTSSQRRWPVCSRRSAPASATR